MAIASAPEKEKTVSYTPAEIFEWLQEQSTILGIEIILYPEKAHSDGAYFYIPTYLPDGKDAFDYAIKLQKFEDAWNDHEPRRNPPINLVSEKSPAQNAVWQRLWDARIRKDKAADAVADAANEAEERQALAELRAVRAEERQAEAENEALNTRKAA